MKLIMQISCNNICNCYDYCLILTSSMLKTAGRQSGGEDGDKGKNEGKRKSGQTSTSA
jgi:hypothetical protein